MGGDLDALESGWRTVVKNGKRTKRLCMGCVCAVDHATNGGPCGGRQLQDYEKVRVTADSGAVDHVAPKSTAAHIPIKETAASRQGGHYIAANGSKISNMGAKRIRGYTKERTPLDMTWQIAEVKRPLASIGKICDAGNTAIFTAKGGFVVPTEVIAKTLGQLESTSHPMLRLNREMGVYSFDMWVHKGGREARTVHTHNQFQTLEMAEEADPGYNPDFAGLGESLF